jgi:hypothetical protein
LHEVESRLSFGSHHQGEDKMIPEFDPQRTDQPVESWVRRVDELAECYRWSDRTTVKLVANRLTGLARRWYDSQDSLAVRWRKMRKVMVKQFSRPIPFTDEGIARAAKASRFQNTNGLYAYLSAIGKMPMTTPYVKSDRPTKPYPTPRNPNPQRSHNHRRTLILRRGV